MVKGARFMLAFLEGIIDVLRSSMGIWHTVLFNAIGIISIFIQIMVFQMKDRKRIIYMNIASNIGWFSYFFLQGGFISGVSNIIGILSNIIFLMRQKYRWADSKLWLILFLAIAATYSALTFEDWRDIFPMLACLSSMCAFFTIKEENIRKISLCSYVLCACNSISHLYAVALIADITAFASIVVALFRYRKKDGVAPIAANAEKVERAAIEEVAVANAEKTEE